MDLLDEIRITGLLSKQYAQTAHAGTAYELVRAATLSGAKALGRPDLGLMEPGAKADLLVYDLFRPHLQPVWDPVKNLVWKGNAGHLVFSMIHGRPVVRDGRLLTMDEGAVMRTAAASARNIWEIGEKRGILPTPPMRG